MFLLRITLSIILLNTLTGCGAPSVWDGQIDHRIKAKTYQYEQRVQFDKDNKVINKKAWWSLLKKLNKSTSIKHLKIAACNNHETNNTVQQLNFVENALSQKGLRHVKRYRNPQGVEKNCVVIRWQKTKIISPQCRHRTMRPSTVERISPHFGCSTANNLAAHLAYPDDLLPRNSKDNFSSEMLGDSLDKLRNKDGKADNNISKIIQNFIPGG